MRGSAVARNYAATLFELAARDSSESLFSDLIEGISELYSQDVSLQRFLDAPSVTPSAKKDVLQQACAEHAPALFVRFLLVLVDRRRQRLLPNIAAAYRDLLDENAFGRPKLFLSKRTRQCKQKSWAHLRGISIRR